MDAKQAGHFVYILGETYEELGGSEWFAMHGYVGNRVPRVQAKRAKKLYRALSRAMKAGLVASCHDCSDGGLGVALAEVAFSGGLGMSVDLRNIPYEGKRRNDYLLFSESQSRFVVTVDPDAKKSFERVMKGSVIKEIGKVLGDDTFKIIGSNGKIIIKEDIQTLKDTWQKPLKF
jgi:phosphoribosylformylglycinamidine synthase